MTAYKLVDPKDRPAQTVETLDALTRQHGMTEAQFMRLHHFGRPGARSGTSIETHRKYCVSLTTGFRGDTNVDVLRRLLLARYLRDEGVDWDRVIASATAAFPFE